MYNHATMANIAHELEDLSLDNDDDDHHAHLLIVTNDDSNNDSWFSAQNEEIQEPIPLIATNEGQYYYFKTSWRQ